MCLCVCALCVCVCVCETQIFVVFRPPTDPVTDWLTDLTTMYPHTHNKNTNPHNPSQPPPTNTNTTNQPTTTALHTHTGDCQAEVAVTLDTATPTESLSWRDAKAKTSYTGTQDTDTEYEQGHEAGSNNWAKWFTCGLFGNKGGVKHNKVESVRVCREDGSMPKPQGRQGCRTLAVAKGAKKTNVFARLWR